MRIIFTRLKINTVSILTVQIESKTHFIKHQYLVNDCKLSKISNFMLKVTKQKFSI